MFGVDFDVSQFYSEPVEDDEQALDDDESASSIAGSQTSSRRMSARRERPLIKEIEPSELERGYLAAADKAIVLEDRPERYQLRKPPVQPFDETAYPNEKRDEADWIIEKAFPPRRQTISRQQANERYHALAADEEEYQRCKAEQEEQRMKHPNRLFPPLPKPLADKQRHDLVANVLEMMRNKLFEPPFIDKYRREDIGENLTNIEDLWRVLDYDAKWLELCARRQKLVDLFRRMQSYQLRLRELKSEYDIGPGLPDDQPLIDVAHIEVVQSARSMEELSDAYAEFQLYHNVNVSRMLSFETAVQEDTQANGAISEVNEEVQRARWAAICERIGSARTASLADRYSVCVQNGLGALATRFGMSPQQLGENMGNAQQVRMHEVEDDPCEPEEAAAEYINERGVFSSVDLVLEGVEFMVAKQLSRDPIIRNALRKMYYERAMLTIYPTKSGLVEIDENHALYPMKYVINKPISSLENDQFLKVVQVHSLLFLPHSFLCISLGREEQPHRNILLARCSARPR